MGKKIIVNERVLKHMLMEMTKERVLINEAISVADAYGKFYSAKLSKDEYDIAVKGTVNMTPYHKALLDCMIYSKESGDYDSNVLARDCGEVWANADANIRQLLLKGVKAKDLNPRMPSEFHDNAIKISQTKVATKAQVANNGLVKLYEDDRVLITCTTTYSASHKFYADSHWCTASDIYGQYNGYCMFINYTINEDACLIQIEPKTYRDGTYQVQMYVDRAGQICDFEDNGRDWDDMINDLTDRIPNISDILTKLLTANLMQDLIRKTEAETNEDSKYWKPKTEERLKEIADLVNTKFELDKYTDAAKEILTNCVRWGEHNGSHYWSGVAVRVYCSPDESTPYFIVQFEIDLDEALDSDASSWIWSCRRLFNTELINHKVFLCKMTDKVDDNGYKTYEVVKELGDYCGGVFSVGSIVAYSNKKTQRDNYSLYNIIDAETGEAILTDKYVNYCASDYIIFNQHEPFEVFDARNKRMVISEVSGFYTSWGDLYIKTKETESHPRSNTHGFMLISEYFRYFGQR